MIKIRVQPFTQEINFEAENGDQVVYQAKASIVSKVFKDNQNGTEDVTLVAKNEVANIAKIGSKVVNTVEEVKTKSRSQSLRQKCFRIAQELGEDDESLYNLVMDKANVFLDNYLDSKKGF